VLAPYLQVRSYRAGQVLWTEGESSGRLTLLEQGRVKAIRVLPDGTSILLYVFSPGDLFGFLPFLDGGTYPATVIAIDELRARVMSRAALKTAIAAEPEVALVLLGALGRRLRQAMSRLGDQAQRNAVIRVAAALLLLVPESSDSGVTLISVPTPLHAFAADVGTTPETFSRAVTRLVGAGVVHRMSPARLQVLDPDRLRAIGAGRDDSAPPSR